MNLNSKVVLLTGGTSGIGQAIARQMKEKGAVVTLTGRNAERLAAMRDEGFSVIKSDLSSSAGVDALIADWGDRPLDILVNNAGYPVDHDFRTVPADPDALDACAYTNFQAPVRLIAGVMPNLRKQERAMIVNVTSGVALAPAAATPFYSAAKAALRSYTMGLREQVKSEGIHVVEALPPPVDTPANAMEGSKMPPAECARQILVAIERDKNEANVGMVKTLRLVESISPALMRRFVLRAV